MSKESVGMIYEANNISFEKCELYGDYIITLINIITDTYMGDDIMDEKERMNHFNWCWGKNIEIFKNEGYLINSDKLYEYFLNYFKDFFYFSEHKKDKDTNDTNTLKLWSHIFDYNSIKTKDDLELFLQLYKIFEFSLNKT